VHAHRVFIGHRFYSCYRGLCSFLLVLAYSSILSIVDCPSGVGWGKVFPTDQLGFLLGDRQWTQGQWWTLRLEAASTCSHELSFGFAHGGGFLKFKVGE